VIKPVLDVKSYSYYERQQVMTC